MSGSDPPGLLLGLDIGTTRIKAVLIDAAGEEHAAASVPTPFAASPDGIDMSVADLDRAVRAVVGALGAPAREQVAAVGVTGMAESGAPLCSGVPTGPVIAWHDGRGEETVASLERRFGPDLALRTGRRLRTVSSVAKLGWLLDHGLPRPDRWLGVPELVLFLLTGAQTTEHSLAARTGAYDVTGRHWIEDVLAHLDLAPGLFPEVRRAGSPMGSISQEAAVAFGLSAGVPATIAGHDHLAAAAGLGVGPEDLANSVGTAETVVRRVGRPPDVARAIELNLAVTVWPGGDSWGVFASAARSGLVVEALCSELGVAPDVLDDLGGPAGERWSATLATLAESTAAAAQRVVALTGPYSRLVVFGGGSRSRRWAEAKAALLGVAVERCPLADAAAHGAALAGGVAAGW